MNTGDIATTLIAVTSRLIDLMGREIELLRSMRPREIESLQADKAGLTRTYVEYVAQLQSEPSRLGAVEPIVRDELRRITERFEESVAENARALRAASEANNRLIKAIIEAAGQVETRHAGYTSTGTSPDRQSGKARGLSLTVNQQL
ncbi:MAG: hypothetical protein U1F33_12915 [Alphaproteobacteria bacterium]